MEKKKKWDTAREWEVRENEKKQKARRTFSFGFEGVGATCGMIAVLISKQILKRISHLLAGGGK